MTRLLAKVGVGWQIGLVSLIALLGFFVIAGFDTYVNHEQAVQRIAAEKLDRRSAAAAALYRAVADARLLEMQFLISHDDKLVEKHAIAVGASAEAMQTLQDNLSNKDEEAAVEQAEVIVGKYIETFDTIIEAQAAIGADEKSGLRGSLSQAAEELDLQTSLLSGVTGSDITAEFLRIRNSEKDFIAQRDPALLDAFSARGVALSGRIGTVGDAKIRAKLDGDLTAYQAEFTKLAALIQQLDLQRVALDRVATEDMVPLIERLAKDVADDSATQSAEGLREMDKLDRFILLSVGAAGLITVALGLLVGRAIARPVVGMAATMHKVADGDLDVEVPGRDRKDEIGEMAAALEIFRHNAQRMEALRSEQEQMRIRAEVERQESLRSLADDFEGSFASVLSSVETAVGKMRDMSQVLRETAEHTRTQAEAAATRSSDGSSVVREMAEVASSLALSIGEIGTKVNRSSEIVRRAVDEARRTDALVRGLTEAAQRIGDVVGMISEIAGQTNLLALNATIEAARAGDAGKGFAVVAGEVKHLAQQTARATEDITRQVAAIQSATHTAADAIQSIRETIEEVDGIAAVINDAVRQQSLATDTITENVSNVSASSGQVVDSVTEMARTAAETGRAAVEVYFSAEELAQQATALHENADRFIAQVRAG